VTDNDPNGELDAALEAALNDDLTAALNRLTDFLNTALAAQEAAEASKARWLKDPRLARLRELGLATTAALIWPMQSTADMRHPNADIIDTVLRCNVLGGPDAVLSHFEAMDDLGEEMAEEGCPMELLFWARGPWSPRNFGFVRAHCP